MKCEYQKSCPEYRDLDLCNEIAECCRARNRIIRDIETKIEERKKEIENCGEIHEEDMRRVRSYARLL